MFKYLLKNKYELVLKKDAESYIKKDRILYKPAFDYIIKFASKNDSLMSNIDLYSTKNDGKIIEYLNIFIENASEFAKSLIGELCNEFGENFLMRISEYDGRYIIEYNIRKICTIKELEISNKIYSIPVKYSYNNTDMYMLSPLIELIELYKLLYNPGKADKWSEILCSIKFLENHVNLSIEAPQEASKVNPNNVSKETISLSKIISQHILDYIADTDYILLGAIDYKMDRHKQKKETSVFINQINTDDQDIQPTLEIISIRTIQSDVNFIGEYINKFVSGALSYKEKDLHLVYDDFMQRYDVYFTNVYGEVMYILSIYNNLTYEPINYIEYKVNLPNNAVSTYKLPDPITELRFLYINLYTGESVYGDDIKKTLQFYKEKIDIVNRKTNYIGNYVDQNIHQKQITIANPNKSKHAFYCYDTKNIE